MLVDHFIEFHGCKRHLAVIGDEITGFQEFVDDRDRLLQQVPQFVNPDFGQAN